MDLRLIALLLGQFLIVPLRATIQNLLPLVLTLGPFFRSSLKLSGSSLHFCVSWGYSEEG